MEIERLRMSDALLAVMRSAAGKAVRSREPFITPRALLLALLEDDGVGPALAPVIDAERLASLAPQRIDVSGVARLPDVALDPGESPAFARYDTLAFKVPGALESAWLNKEALQIFLEGAQRADERYEPKHLALGFAAEAVRQPGVLAAIRVEPGRLADAVYAL